MAETFTHLHGSSLWENSRTPRVNFRRIIMIYAKLNQTRTGILSSLAFFPDSGIQETWKTTKNVIYLFGRTKQRSKFHSQRGRFTVRDSYTIHLDSHSNILRDAQRLRITPTQPQCTVASDSCSHQTPRCSPRGLNAILGHENPSNQIIGNRAKSIGVPYSGPSRARCFLPEQGDGLSLCV